jgi:Fe-S-cluster containining protein
MTEAPPFERTTCACAECTQCCRDQPGYLRPGDLERIAAHRGETVAEASRFFWSSEGALVMNLQTGRQFRIRTITPRRERGKCVFLDDQGRCTVHAVAPFGCAYFDTHMSGREGQTRSSWALREVQHDDAYHELRKTLIVATSYKPKGYK